MIKILQIILLNCFMAGLLFFSERVSAQPNTLYFMKGIPQTKDLNPSRPGIEDGFYFGMPGFSKLDLSLNTNNWSYSDLIHPGTGTRADSLVVDLNRFTSAIGNRNFINESFNLTLLEAGIKSGKHFFSFSLSEKEFAEFYFHRNLINLINHGNYPYVGSVFNAGTLGFNAQHYRELAFTYARDVNKQFSAGITAKVLFGMGAVHTNALKLRAISPAKGDVLDITASGKAFVSAPISFNWSEEELIESVSDHFTASSYLNNYHNPGLAFDLGFSFQKTEKLLLSASLLDLGIISWNANTTQFKEQGHFAYRGVDIANPGNLQSVINQVGDSLRENFKLHPSEKGFSTFLPVKMYLGGEYQLNDRTTLAGLARLRFSGNTVHTSLTTSANVLIWNAISLSGSYSIMESTFDNLGAGIGFKAGPVQIYAVSDNIFSPLHPAEAKNINLRLGINFIFHKNEKESGGEVKGLQKPYNRNKKECGCPY